LWPEKKDNRKRGPRRKVKSAQKKLLGGRKRCRYPPSGRGQRYCSKGSMFGKTLKGKNYTAETCGRKRGTPHTLHNRKWWNDPKILWPIRRGKSSDKNRGVTLGKKGKSTKGSEGVNQFQVRNKVIFTIVGSGDFGTRQAV